MAAPNQLAAWEEGMLKLPPLPTRTMASDRVWNGRNRATPFLIESQTSQLPRHNARASISTQTRPRAPPFKMRKPASVRNRQGNNGESLTNGISRSKKELLNDALMKRKSETSMDCSQPVMASA